MGKRLEARRNFPVTFGAVLASHAAEATRQAMIRSGINPDRFQRIEGVADRELLIKDSPSDPRNRRISITVLH